MYNKHKRWGCISVCDENRNIIAHNRLNERGRFVIKPPKNKRRNMGPWYSTYLSRNDQKSSKVSNDDDDNNNNNDDDDDNSSIINTTNNDISFDDQNDTRNDQDNIDMISDSEFNIDSLLFNSNYDYDDQNFDQFLF